MFLVLSNQAQQVICIDAIELHCSVSMLVSVDACFMIVVHTDRGGFRGGGLSYMKNDIMHTVIYAAFCMLPSLDLQACTSIYRSSQAGSISI